MASEVTGSPKKDMTMSMTGGGSTIEGEKKARELEKKVTKLRNEKYGILKFDYLIL